MDPNPRYQPSWLIRLIHSRPHWDISFRVVNDTFNLKDELYLESLGIWASGPALVLILSLIVLFFYLLAYCCRRQKAKRHSYGFLRWVLVFFAILCCGALACALYGNEAVHSSIGESVRHLDSINRRTSGIRNQTEEVRGKLEKDIEPRLDIISQEFSRQLDDPQVRVAVENMLRNATDTKSTIASVHARINQLDYSKISVFIAQVESIRWPVTIAVMGVFVFFCFVLILGLIKRSRRTLMLFSVLGLIATVIAGLLVCALFVIAMGLSDICWAPNDFVLDNMGKQYPRPVVEYYVKCEPLAESPFERFITDGLRAVTSLQNSLGDVTNVVEKFGEDKMRQHPQLQPNLVKLGQAINATGLGYVSLGDSLQCRRIHRDYVYLVDSACNKLMLSLTWMLLSVAGTFVLFFLLVILDSHLWIYMKKSRNYLNTEETDPFLPRGQHSHSSGSGSLGRQANITMTSSLGPNYRTRHHKNIHTPPQTPPFSSTLNGRTNQDKQQQQQQYAAYQYQQYHNYPPGAHNMSTLPISSISTLPGPNHGQYATLSRHCKTLESSNFY